MSTHHHHHSLSSNAVPRDIPKPASADELAKNGKKKKSFMSNIFRKKGRSGAGSSDKRPPSRRDRDFLFDLEEKYGERERADAAAAAEFVDASPAVRKSVSDRHCAKRIESLTLSCLDSPNRNVDTREYRVFVGTWNVGGRPPNSSLNLEDFLQIEGLPDIYVLGFQEIVPLNAGNVLVVEDNEPAAKWLALIYQALNKPQQQQAQQDQPSSGDELSPTESVASSSSSRARPSIPRSSSSGTLFFSKPTLKALSKSYRVNSALVKTCTCMADPSTMHRRAREMRDFIYRVEASPHLASGEKDGDEVRRNSDVAEILKSTQFPRICKVPGQRIPEKIIDHDRIIWLGDLNYRVALSYEETRVLLEQNDWDTLLENDQLMIERQAGRVFKGWKEGKIYFAPTYKYKLNSDTYAGETTKSKRKRRTPSWCDRILWHGKGIEQLQYIRGEHRFSDHRPVCSVFVVEADADNGSRIRKGYSTLDSRVHCESPLPIPQRHSFYDF
ncbi:unnamed protein product [Triticum turgidum subsp. durum]|uniref:Inositol polyphosphate-related phosphatase domain-containing protein n=1 Tax=Triticum turgidum subsp. durum TaxID=4567 RepID=A0A9R0Y6E6_TRITD|nr:unnamed protein product [Triticum turgidum subsp. durum]